MQNTEGLTSLSLATEAWAGQGLEKVVWGLIRFNKFIVIITLLEKKIQVTKEESGESGVSV